MTKITHAQMMAIPYHLEWDEGLGGYMFYRFSSVVHEGQRILADISWEDDSEEDDEDEDADVPEGDEHLLFFKPVLEIEADIENVGGVCGFEVELTQEEAEKILREPPANLLIAYGRRIAKLVQTRDAYVKTHGKKRT